MMHATVLLVLFVTFIAAAKGLGNLWLHKCCKPYQMLSGDGKTCVESSWPHDADLRYESNANYSAQSVAIRPLDPEWMRRWMPLSIPLHAVEGVFLDAPRLPNHWNTFVRPVRRAGMWSPRLQPADDYWKGRVVLDREGRLMRPRRGGGFRRTEWFCVDAAQPPLAPFALVFRLFCSLDDCAIKCCGERGPMALRGGRLQCLNESRGAWSVSNSSFRQFLDPEKPSTQGSSIWKACPLRAIRLQQGDEQSAHLLVHYNHYKHLKEACVDFERTDQHSELVETLLFCDRKRFDNSSSVWATSQGAYAALRPLSFATVFLLLMAIMGILSDRRLRQKAHGWALGCHAVCLLIFNLGQLAYYFTMSESIDFSVGIPSNLWNVCENLGIAMYFFLIAAASWLTTVCINMAAGFK